MGTDVQHLRARITELEARVAARRANVASTAPLRPHWLFFAPIAVLFVVGLALPFRSDEPARAVVPRVGEVAATEEAAARCEETKASIQRRVDHCAELVEYLESTP